MSVLTSRNELAHGTAGGLLHGDALRLCSFPQGFLFAVSEAERHSHVENGISSIPNADDGFRKYSLDRNTAANRRPYGEPT